MTDTPDQTASLLHSLNEAEMVENMTWWVNLRDEHTAKGQHIAARRCQEEIDLWRQELAEAIVKMAVMRLGANMR